MNSKFIFLTALCAFSFATPFVQAQSELEVESAYSKKESYLTLTEDTKRYLLWVAGYGLSTAVLYACSLPLHNYFDAQLQESYTPITNFKELVEIQKANPDDFYGYMFGYAVRARDTRAFSKDYNQLEHKHFNIYLVQNIAAVTLGAVFSQWAYNYLYQPQDELTEQTR